MDEVTRKTFVVVGQTEGSLGPSSRVGEQGLVGIRLPHRPRGSRCTRRSCGPTGDVGGRLLVMVSRPLDVGVRVWVPDRPRSPGQVGRGYGGL